MENQHEIQPAKSPIQKGRAFLNGVIHGTTTFIKDYITLHPKSSISGERTFEAIMRLAIAPLMIAGGIKLAESPPEIPDQVPLSTIVDYGYFGLTPAEVRQSIEDRGDPLVDATNMQTAANRESKLLGLSMAAMGITLGAAGVETSRSRAKRQQR